jgi:TIR domain-containing protein
MKVVAALALLMLSASGDTEAPIWIWPVLAGGIVASAAAIPFLRMRWGRTVFVSYRRADGAEESARIAGKLAQRFGRGRVFLDVRSIRPGENFRISIERKLRTCDAVLVLMGPQWATLTDESGAIRLQQEDDMVRVEVAAALESGALVIPVLLRGARLPERNQLPPDLRNLLDLQGLTLPAEQVEGWLPVLIETVSRANVRRTPLMVLLSHFAIAVLLFVFYLTDGMQGSEFLIALGLVSSMLSATAGVALVYGLQGLNPARVRQVPTSSLLLPLSFVGVAAVFVVLRSLNLWGFGSRLTFLLSVGALEIVFSAYTGVVLSSLFENRSKT